MRRLCTLTTLWLSLCHLASTNAAGTSPKSPPRQIPIDRSQVVSRFNPVRNASSTSTPMQVGNGNFAFGADITGLQTFLPYNTLSSWGWHNSSLPANSSPSDFTGLDWWTHGRLVNYDMPNPAESEISQWLIANPHRINLVRIGFVFLGRDANFTEEDLPEDRSQVLDIYHGVLRSSFTVDGHTSTVWTCVDPLSDTVAVRVKSNLLSLGQLGLFFDYPYATDKNKFEAPFVGDWDAVDNHTTVLRFANGENQAQIRHTLDNTTYLSSVQWNRSAASITKVDDSHRYILRPTGNSSREFELTASVSPNATSQSPLFFDTVVARSQQWWQSYWETGAFVDLTGTDNTTAIEIQRRVILSQYLLAVNEAGKDPPQESGLVNNGWHGKFHMEMYLWHSSHWTPWGKLPLLERSIGVYERFLPSSLQRAADQGYAGTRWGKMSDPSGRSAPGEINALLIWQQPHVFYFAEAEYHFARSTGQETRDIFTKWDHIPTESADFMASYDFWNSSTGVYDLGPPMYPVSENTPPNSTCNPTFELAYWHFGLDTAIAWKTRLGQPPPSSWKHVKDRLAPLPTMLAKNSSGDEVLTYTLYEGIPDMWTDPDTVTDHPALTGIYGLLPPSSVVNETIVAATAAEVGRVWNFTDCWGWDFPMLAMNVARLGDVEDAVRYLVHANFEFDDVGMPVGSKAPTPYFPGSAALLLAVGMMAGGWDAAGNASWQGMAPGFPSPWKVKAEGFQRML
ncbi:hypothetical protein BO71DRAFT_110435 [Aspergillus ellipticus CBS 707.79]|uniref:Lipo protein n=1 Tax=Aspergillus ellipticus CBS 707.79 TaxID=1448320 RepID=A0A319DMM7_9EURO|nr:hypothetical protein BO71DRAFT_110435 [Aspergillus ellipticus CBS 707.79]